jgi:integrase
MAKNSAPNRLLPQNVRSIEKTVRSAAAKGNDSVIEYRIRNARGLVLHVMPSGRATWYAHYDNVEGTKRRRRKLKLGRFDELDLADAVAAAANVRSSVRKGLDPVKIDHEQRNAITFAELANLRLREGRALRPTTLTDYRHLLQADIFPALRSLPACGVSRGHVIDLLDTISARGSTRRADTARAIISSVFSFGMDRGLVTDNPASGLKNRHQYKPRDVILETDQIRALWRAVNNGNAAMSESVRQIVKLALLSGQRRAEIAGLRRADVTLDGERPAFVITQDRAKNAMRHSVPLSRPAREILIKAMSNGEEQPYVFPGRPGCAIQPGSVTKAFVRTREKLEEAGFRLHDLRRTVASLLASYGVPRDVRELVFNHRGGRKNSVTEGVYTWYDYDAEKRAALELWAHALECITDERDGEIEDYYSRLARLKASAKIRVGYRSK